MQERTGGGRGAGRFDRDLALGRLAAEQFDLLVIGGGITGAGVALDAASRGLKTALVERDDFASGTSSKSSKMVHGGLRYLQQHEYRLVYENLAERQRLLENAPHLVSPLPFLIPLFGRGGVLKRGVARVYRSALWMYDLTGGMRIGRRHERVSREQALAHMPTLQTDRLAAGFLYWDARADDARLTLAVLRTAVLDFHAAAANHAEVSSLSIGEDGRVDGALVEPHGREPFTVRASVVVNATGVWTDSVRAMAEGRNPRSIRPAKGIHVTVPYDALPCDIAAVIPVKDDRRSIFVVSWGDQVYLGTTDTSWDGSLDDPACLPEDVDYLLDAANEVTTRPLARSDVTGLWTGLRPLLAPVEGKSAPSARTADLSRRHTVDTSTPGLVTITGGKLTTYRRMAEDAVDAALRSLGWPVVSCNTRALRLRGAGHGERAPARRNGNGRVAGDRDGAGAAAAHLAGRYGADTPDVLALADGRPELLEPLVPGLRYLGAEAVYAVREEMARSLADVLDRRTRASLRDARATASAARRVAELIGSELGWDAARCAAEADAYAGRILADLRRAGLDPETAPGTAPGSGKPGTTGASGPPGSADAAATAGPRTDGP